MLRKKFIALNAYIRKEKTPKINNLSLHFRKLQEQIIIPKEAEEKK